MLLVNLPVADIARSRVFFADLGFGFDDLLCDAGTICMVVNDATMVLLHRRTRFAAYAATPIEPRDGREALLAITVGSRAEVDRLADTALAGGGSALRQPEDLGFMYCRSFCDLDGHAWEAVFLDAGQCHGLGAVRPGAS